jgi:hypothetical protein
LTQNRQRTRASCQSILFPLISIWCLWCYSECISTPGKLEKYSPEYITPTQKKFMITSLHRYRRN